MASRKNHHYIPQFHLKNFSVRKENRLIGLYNHLKELYVPEAAIRKQACEKWLYGKDDEIEQALCDIEGVTAGMFRIMLKAMVPPSPESNAYTILKRYLLYQMFRTVKSGNDFLAALNKSMHEIWRLYPDYKEKYSGLTVQNEEATLATLLYSEQMLPYLNFMQCKLIVNLTNFEFITSDNPVVKYNQFMEAKNKYQGATGITAMGLQIFFPIHPRMMICLYDPYVYKFGDKKSYRIVTESEDEVHQLNALQYVMSNEQLFFSDLVNEAYLKYLIDRYGHRRENTGAFSKTIHQLDENGKTRNYIFNTFIDPKISLSLGFIKILKKAKRVDLNRDLVNIRHESFYELEKNLRKNFQNG